MKRPLGLLMLLPALVLLFHGCSNVLMSEYEYGDEFTLGHNQRALVGGETLLRFLGVPEDSRCPGTDDCVWEGNARAEFEMRVSGNDPVRFSLNTHHNFPQIRTVNGVTVELRSVEPYPETPTAIDPEAYSVQVVVSN